MLGYSAGTSGTMRAQYHLRQVMIFLDMRPVNKQDIFIPAAGNLFDENGDLTDSETGEPLNQPLGSLATWAK